MCAAYRTGDLDTARSLAASLLFTYRDNARLQDDDSLICTRDGSGAASSTAAASGSAVLALGIVPPVDSITHGSSDPMSLMRGDATPLHGADEVLGDDLSDDNAASDAEPYDWNCMFASLQAMSAQRPGDATPLQGADEGLAGELADGDSCAIAPVPTDATPLHGADEVLRANLPDDNAASDAEPGDRDVDPNCMFASLFAMSAQPKERKERKKPLAESDFIAEFLFNARRDDGNDTSSNDTSSRKSDLSDVMSEVSDLDGDLHIGVESNKSWITPEDEDIACIDTLSKHMRQRPLLPPHPTDANESWLEADSGIAFPVCHCRTANDRIWLYEKEATMGNCRSTRHGTLLQAMPRTEIQTNKGTRR